MEASSAQDYKEGVGTLAGHTVIHQSCANTLITEEPDDLKVTSGSVGGAAREGGSYPEAGKYFASLRSKRKIFPCLGRYE